MAVSLSIRVDGIPELKKQLDRLSPKKNPRWVRRALIDCAELTQKISAEEKIIRGGRFRGPKGPRGGKGKMTDAAVHATKLTSRSGRLRDSIRVNHSPLPWAIEVGTDVVYAAVHEFGGKHHPPRPYLGPGLEDAAKKFDDIFMREWKKEMP
jgi:HK97 gp10 family phage protein